MLMIVQQLKLKFVKRIKICNELIHHVFHPFLQRLASFPQICPFLKNAHVNSVTNFSSVRDFLTLKKNLCVCTISSSTKLVPHLRLLFRTFTRMYMYFLTRRMSISATKWTFLVVLCASLQRPYILCPLLPQRLESTLLWLKDLLHVLSVSRAKRLWETDLQNCVNHSWHSVRLCVHPRFAEQNNIRSLFFFLPRSTLESISYSPSLRVTRRICPTDTPCRETRQHALAFAFNKYETKVKSFHQIFSSERIRVPKLLCNTEFPHAPAISIQLNFSLLQTLWLLSFWNNGFPHACSGIRSSSWNSSFPITFQFLVVPSRQK